MLASHDLSWPACWNTSACLTEVKAVKTLICSLLAAQITMGHLPGDRLQQKLSRKKLFGKKIAARRYSGMEKGNSYHAHVSYPDCRIFLSYILRIRREKNTMFPSILCHTWHLLESFHPVSTAFQKYLYNGCNFNFAPGPNSPLSRVQKLKFHHAPKDIAGW